MISLTSKQHIDLLIVGLLMIASIHATTDSSQPKRVQDSLFNSSTLLLGRLVTCDNHSDGVYKFPSPTWSCYNIRVDGIRIQNQLFQSVDVKTPFDCPEDEQGRNDLGALCRHLLKAHHIERDLWAALVVRHPTCGSSGDARVTFQAASDEEEYLGEHDSDFYENELQKRVRRESRDHGGEHDEESEPKEEQFHWKTFQRGKGYIQTLRCMVAQ